MLFSYLYLGLPCDLLVRGFHLNIFLTVLVPGILCTWPNQLSLWALIQLTIFLRFISLSSSYMLLLPEGQTGQTWEPPKQQCCFGNRGVLDRNVIECPALTNELTWTHAPNCVIPYRKSQKICHLANTMFTQRRYKLLTPCTPDESMKESEQL